VSRPPWRRRRHACMSGRPLRLRPSGRHLDDHSERRLIVSSSMNELSSLAKP
jgi:hypothetical protein